MGSQTRHRLDAAHSLSSPLLKESGLHCHIEGPFKPWETSALSASNGGSAAGFTSSPTSSFAQKGPGLFFNLVDAPRSAILPFIQTLHLEFRGLRLLDERQLLQFRESRNLTSLWIWVPGWSDSADYRYTRYSSLEFHASVLGANAPSISSIAITIERIPLDTAARVISSFPSLETISLSGDALVGKRSPPACPLPPRIHTLRFNVRDEGAEGFFSYLLSLPNPLLFKTVELNLAHAEASGALAGYFRNSGGTIQHLELLIHSADRFERDFFRRNFDRDPTHAVPSLASDSDLLLLAVQCAPNLRRLCIGAQNSDSIYDIVLAVSSHSLIECRLRFVDDTHDVPWGDTD